MGMSWIDKKIGNFLEKQLIQRVTANNKFYEAIYGFLSNNIKLDRDTDTTDYVKKGYEGNPDVFGIVSKIARKTARVPLMPVNDQDEEQEFNPLEEFFNSQFTDETFFEHRMRWSAFGLVCGESLVYYKTLEKGNNEGKLHTFNDMPPQDIDIKFGKPNSPIKAYVVKNDEDRLIDPVNVWHTRLFPNLDYTGGKNFRGLSPIKVAAMIVSAQNAGYNITADTYNRGMPLGIMTKVEESYQKTLAKQQKNDLEKQWTRQAGKNMPLFTLGDLRWIKLSYDTLRDLQILESNENGLRVLCRILSVPSGLFGDKKATTYNNVKEDKKEMYDERIIPDVELYVQGVNKIIYPICGIKYKPDYSKIDALQQDKLELAKILEIASRNKKITGNEFREALGYDPIDEPEFTEEGLVDEINRPSQMFNFNQREEEE